MPDVAGVIVCSGYRDGEAFGNVPVAQSLFGKRGHVRFPTGNIGAKLSEKPRLSVYFGS